MKILLIVSNLKATYGILFKSSGSFLQCFQNDLKSEKITNIADFDSINYPTCAFYVRKYRKKSLR